MAFSYTRPTQLPSSCTYAAACKREAPSHAKAGFHSHNPAATSHTSLPLFLSLFKFAWPHLRSPYTLGRGSRPAQALSLARRCQQIGQLSTHPTATCSAKSYASLLHGPLPMLAPAEMSLHSTQFMPGLHAQKLRGTAHPSIKPPYTSLLPAAATSLLSSLSMLQTPTPKPCPAPATFNRSPVTPTSFPHTHLYQASTPHS